MEKDWVKIYTSPDAYRVAIVEAVLKDNNMEVVQMNKRDSSYLNFGEVELYIHTNNFQQAIEIIIKNEL